MPAEIQNTILAAAPYADDYDESKKFHRVVFRPAVPVQARELTQLQTILQNQVERFGDHIFKTGSVIRGCGVTYQNDTKYVAVRNNFSTNTDFSTTDTVLVGAVAYGTETGVQATIIAGVEGFEESASPAKLFLKYTQNGPNNQTEFVAGEPIRIFKEDESYISQIELTVANAANFATNDIVVGANSAARGTLTSSNTTTNTITLTSVHSDFDVSETVFVLANTSVNTSVTSIDLAFTEELGTIEVISANTTNAQGYLSTGNAYAVTVGEGVIYQKGFFIAVSPQTIVVDEWDNLPANKSVGFETIESVVNEFMDDSLFDNAAGSSNENAPGAHRLKLDATLAVYDTDSIPEDSIFFPIIEFSDSGAVFQRTDPSYNALGEALAKRTYEESGDYVVDEFHIKTVPDELAPLNVEYQVDPGIAYVKGNRIETKNNINVSGRRGTDTASYENQILTMNYATYVEANQIRGYFPVGELPRVDLYDTKQNAIDNGRIPSTVAPIGTKIGEMAIRNMVYSAGEKGSPACAYRMYLQEIAMTGGNLFGDVQSIVYMSNSTFYSAFADVEPGWTKYVANRYDPMMWKLSDHPLKNLLDANGNADTSFFFTHELTSSIANTGVAAFTITTGGVQYGFTSSFEADEQKIDLVLTGANLESVPLAGTVSITGNTVTGTGTSFVDDFAVGEKIKTGANTAQILTISSATSMLVDSGTGLANGVYSKFYDMGSVISLEGSTRTIDVTGSTLTINLGSEFSGTNPGPEAKIRVYARQTSAVSIPKEVKRDQLVRATFASANTVMNIGVPDVFALRGVFAGANSTTNSAFILTKNYANSFILNDGQRGKFYNHASVRLKPGSDTSEFIGRNLLVQFDCFVANTSSGTGFFSVESFPVDDSIGADRAVSIRTVEIPVRLSTNGDIPYDLRSTIDFRPYRTPTATLTNVIADSTLNPPSSETFTSPTVGYAPFPGQNFDCNFTHYLPRKDLLVLSQDEELYVIEGSSSLTPILPKVPEDSISLASIDVPPYPSLSDTEYKEFKRPESLIRVKESKHRRFTMKDIAAIEQRVSSLEYYVSLSMLEKSAAELSVSDANGLDRFKNGFFVDPFNNHNLARTEDSEHTIAIDSVEGVGRPGFVSQIALMEIDSANNTSNSSSFVSAAYTDVVFINQPYASVAIPVDNVVSYLNGTIVFDTYEFRDVRQSYDWVAKSTPIDAKAADLSSSKSKEAIATRYPKNQAVDPLDNQKNYVVTIEQPEFRTIKFVAWGLKTKTIHYMTLNGKDIGQYIVPGIGAGHSSPQTSTKNGAFGDELKSTSGNGYIEGIMVIPSSLMGEGHHRFLLSDVKPNDVGKLGVGISSRAESLVTVRTSESLPGTKPKQTPGPVAVPVVPKTLYADFEYSGSTTQPMGTSHVLTYTSGPKFYAANTAATPDVYEWDFGTSATPSTATGPGPHVVTYTNAILTYEKVRRPNTTLRVTRTSDGATGGIVKPISLYVSIPPPVSGNTITILPVSSGVIVPNNAIVPVSGNNTVRFEIRRPITYVGTGLLDIRINSVPHPIVNNFITFPISEVTANLVMEATYTVNAVPLASREYRVNIKPVANSVLTKPTAPSDPFTTPDIRIPRTYLEA